MPIYETHCHLNHSQFDNDLHDVLNRAVEANVGRLLVVGFDLTSSRRAVSLAADQPALRTAVGIHPEDVVEWSQSARDELINLVRNNRLLVTAWGEIGLDYHWETYSRNRQRTVFIEQLDIASSLDLPVIIHCRDAYDDTLDVLAEHGKSRGVLHCFTGTAAQAERGLALGFHIGVGGVVTYKNSADVREMVRTLPLDRILIETDCPFLAPQQWRGKRNEPAYLTAVVAKLAEVFGRFPFEIEDQTWNNAEALFG